MRAKRLRSLLIDRIVLDDERGTLAVWFRNARRHVREGVPRAVYDAFGQAESAGGFFNERVKGRFAGRSDPAVERRRPPVRTARWTVALPERIGEGAGARRRGGEDCGSRCSG